jgi:hypothetical protein
MGESSYESSFQVVVPLWGRRVKTMIAFGADLEPEEQILQDVYARESERDDSLAERARSAPGGGRVGRSLTYHSKETGPKVSFQRR